MGVYFPDIKPSGRSYSPGDYAQTVFEAQNGAKTVIRHGSKRVNAQLSVSFSNITDAEVVAILQNYRSVNSEWDYVNFRMSNVLAGLDRDTLADGWVAERQNLSEKSHKSGLRWRYSSAPKVTSVQPGISNVSCSFVGCLDGD